MLILAVTLWLGVSATAHAQVNTVSTVTGAIVPSGRGVTGATGGSVSTVAPVAVPCPFGVSLSADLTAFGCASDPLGAPTYQIPAEAGATAVTVVRPPAGGIASNVAGGGVSSSARCLGAILSTAGNAGAGDLFGGIGGC